MIELSVEILRAEVTPETVPRLSADRAGFIMPK
jgi:hypothetical protein